MVSKRYLSASLILQTLQQLRDVYGDSVDKIVQGNTENIVFLKSTDDSMIDTLVKMSGTTHESRTDSKTITKDNERVFNKNEGKISYTMTTKERPVIQFNDFMFIKERNSIILKAGGSPIWNRNETAYPMSWRLLMNTIRIPGKEFSLQTIPTNSTAKDFDVRKNQPDFFAMLDQRIKQAKLTEEYRQTYLDAYGLSETDLIRLDQNVVADDIMHAVNSKLFNLRHRTADELSEEEMAMEFDEFGEPIDGSALAAAAEDNTEVLAAAASAQAEKAEHSTKRYANGRISRDDLVAIGGQVNRQLDKVLAVAYDEAKAYFEGDNNYRMAPTGELTSPHGELYVRSSDGSNRPDIRMLEDAEDDTDTRVFGEEGSVGTFYEVTDAFIKHLAEKASWSDIAGGRFDSEAARAYDQLKR